MNSKRVAKRQSKSVEKLMVNVKIDKPIYHEKILLEDENIVKLNPPKKLYMPKLTPIQKYPQQNKKIHNKNDD